MKKTLLTAAVAAVSVPSFAQSNPTQNQLSPQVVPAKPAKDTWAFLPEVVATVDGEKITKEQVIAAVKSMTRQLTQQGLSISMLPPKYLKNYVKQAINRRIESAVLLKLAKKDGIEPSPALAEKAVEIFTKQINNQKAAYDKLPAERRKQIDEQLAKQNMTVEKAVAKQKEEMKKDVMGRAQDKEYQKKLAIQVWIDEKVVKNIEVTDADEKKYYEDNIKQFSTPERVDASHILIIPEGADPRKGIKPTQEAKDAAKKKIEDILAKVNAGEDFGKLAEQYSACPSGKRSKGDLGFFGKGQMDPAFEKAAFALKKGEVSGIVESSFGYHIIKCNKKEAAKTAPFDEVKNAIKERLKGQKIGEKIKSCIDAEKKECDIKMLYNPEAK